MRTRSLEVNIPDLDTSDHVSSPSLAVFSVIFFLLFSVSLFVVVIYPASEDLLYYHPCTLIFYAHASIYM